MIPAVTLFIQATCERRCCAVRQQDLLFGAACVVQNICLFCLVNICSMAWGLSLHCRITCKAKLQPQNDTFRVIQALSCKLPDFRFRTLLGETPQKD